MKTFVKHICFFVALVIAFNSTAFAASLYAEKDIDNELSTLFGESIYICSGEESFDLDISEFENLLKKLKSNKEHDFYSFLDASINTPETSLYLELANSYRDNFIFSSSSHLESIILSISTPRAPPLFFV